MLKYLSFFLENLAKKFIKNNNLSKNYLIFKTKLYTLMKSFVTFKGESKLSNELLHVF